MANKLDGLHPELKKKIMQLVNLCENKGIRIRITQGYRSAAEQNALYAKGRTAPGPKVTNARGGYSMHNWGVAFDFALDMDVDGDGRKDDDLYNTSTGLFKKVGELGESIGLIWGGRWQTMPDQPHLQLATWGDTTSRLRQLYGTPEKFFATWPKEDPDDKYGEKITEKKFVMIESAFLRTSPKVNKNKVLYKDLSKALKNKCDNHNGYALMKAGSTFTRIRSYKDKDGNKWKQAKSGYWIPALYNNERKAKEKE